MKTKKLQVFVSSTYLDLQQERQAAVEAILKAGHIPAGMELFAAGNESQLETVRRWIDESDIFMLILGSRYGSLEPVTALSYVELEYDYALSRDMPVFAVVMSDEAIDRKVKEQGRQIIELEHSQELELFRRRVLSRICSFFIDAKDIKLAVHETMSDLLVRSSLRGWVRGDDPSSLNSLLVELARVNQRNEKLKTQCKRFQLQLERPPRNNKYNWSDEELDAIVGSLRPIEIEVSDTDDSGAETTSLLWALQTFRDYLVTGISNHVGMSERDKLLYFEVCPKLAVYELATLEKVAGVAWQRFILTAKGRALLAYIDRTQPGKKDAEEKLQDT